MRKNLENHYGELTAKAWHEFTYQWIQARKAEQAHHEKNAGEYGTCVRNIIGMQNFSREELVSLTLALERPTRYASIRLTIEDLCNALKTLCYQLTRQHYLGQPSKKALSQHSHMKSLQNAIDDELWCLQAGAVPDGKAFPRAGDMQN